MTTQEEIEYQKYQHQKAILEQKKLKIFNGRGFRNITTKIEYDHLFVCAKTQKQLVELCKQVGYTEMNLHEFQEYWIKGCWGKQMINIEPEIGVWASLRTNPFGEVVRLV